MYKVKGGALGAKKLNSADALILHQGGSAMEYYIGLDVQKRTISYSVKDGSGKVHSQGQLPATRYDLSTPMAPHTSDLARDSAAPNPGDVS
jgi:hypothetical protein